MLLNTCCLPYAYLYLMISKFLGEIVPKSSLNSDLSVVTLGASEGTDKPARRVSERATGEAFALWIVVVATNVVENKNATGKLPNGQDLDRDNTGRFYELPAAEIVVKH